MIISNVNTTSFAQQQTGSLPQPLERSGEEHIGDSLELGTRESMSDTLLPRPSQCSAEAPVAKAAGAPSQDALDVAKRIAGTEGNPEDVIFASGTDGDDVITIKKAPNISIAVTINGEEKVYGFGDSRRLIIDGGAGNDRIITDKEVGLQLFIAGGEGNDYIVGGSHGDTIIDNYGYNTIDGGDGDDTIIARGYDYRQASGSEKAFRAPELSAKDNIDGNVLIGGPGQDYLEAGPGNDLLEGGDGNDTIYGGAGNDQIDAGSGNDYVDGGAGNDRISAPSGKNLLFGGSGDDTITGGQDRDVVVGGAGNDALAAGEGKNIIIASGQDQVSAAAGDEVSQVEPMQLPENLQIKGSEGYQARVGNDLEFIASVGIGQTMLKGIAESGMQVKVSEFIGGNRCASDATGKMNEDGSPNLGSNATVKYDEARVSTRSLSPWSDRPPLVGLYHEMAHAYNAATGTMDPNAYTYEGKKVERGVPGSEFQAVGIDNGAVKQNPEGVSENAMRSLLGLMQRESY